MKNILIPIDFSKNAENALAFAISLAAGFGADIHLVHAYHSTSHAGHLANVDRVIKEDRDKEMNGYLEKAKTLAGNLNLNGRCRKGYAVEIIKDEVEKVNADLIVMGTLGASNVSKKIMGSTTSNLIKNIETPILAIPASTENTGFDNLVVALDALNSPDPSLLNPMMEIAKNYAASVHLIHVSKETLHTDVDPDVKNHLSASGLAFSFTKILSEDTLEGILNFSEEKENSMLCLVSRQRNWFGNLFHNSISQQIAKKAASPLLILHD